MFFSKSKYCGFWQCPKMTWLDKYKPEEKVIESDEVQYKIGHQVGEMAKTLFGNYVDTTVVKEDGKLDISAMIKNTEEEIAKGTENICEAAFSYSGLYCAVDILHKEKGGYAIYEVKSSTKKEDEEPNYIYMVDIAYQKYVLEKSGITVTGTYLVQLNKHYVRQGDIDVKQLFFIQDVSRFIQEEYEKIDDNIAEAERVLNSAEEPDIDLSSKCTKPYKCAFWQYCAKRLPEHNVFDLYYYKSKFKRYAENIISFDDLLNSKINLSDVQRRQIEFSKKGDDDIYFDKLGIKSFLSTLSYPLYFLDFETMQSAIPQFDGTTPYQQIPFQYSLHYIEKEGGELHHKEFLAVSGENPLRKIAESLCENIPQNVCTLAYYKSFECGRLEELAKLFPDLSEHLTNIKDNVKDLLVPFQEGFYYKKAMGGSFSIKSVLPAIFPDDPALNYHNLDGVHNGSEAMEIFPRIKDMPTNEQEKARENLLKYCELDTLAMVKVLEELKRVVK